MHTNEHTVNKHTAGVQGDSQSHAHLLSIAIDCDVITHFPLRVAQPLGPLMTMIHSVWSDNSVYAPANKREWKSERVIAVYVQATASEATPHSLAAAHTHIQAGATSIHTPALSICAPFTASTELITPTVLWVLGLYRKQAHWSHLHPTQF